MKNLKLTNPLVEKYFSLERKMNAIGTNVDDYREEMHCAKDHKEREELRQVYLNENDKLKAIVSESKDVKEEIINTYGRKSFDNMESFYDRKRFSLQYMTKKEKNKINLTTITFNN